VSLADKRNKKYISAMNSPIPTSPADGAKIRGVGRVLISRPSSIGLMRRQPHRVADEFGYT
jgi:hypothetical protein